MTREDKDAIIRRIEAMYGEAEDNETKEALFYAIEALKEQRPHGEWIPCSERLPERDEIVLVSFKTGMVQMCKYLDDGSPYSWWSYKDDCLAWNNTVDAWMPLPEPYKEGR